MRSDPELVGYGECLATTNADVDAERLRIPLPEELDNESDAEDSVMPAVATCADQTGLMSSPNGAP